MSFFQTLFGVSSGAKAAQTSEAIANGDNGEELERIFGFFKTAYPDEWRAMHLGPARDAIEQMIAKLKG